MAYGKIREEELKNRVGLDYFPDYDTSKIIGNIDFTVTPTRTKIDQKTFFEEHSLLWAEAKKGKCDIVAMFAQLILTIGRARTFDKHLPPAFLAVFDCHKIAFLPYEKIQHLFFQNDFNWNVTSSNRQTKEFQDISSLIKEILNSDRFEYEFGIDDKELVFFIKNNVANSSQSGKIRIDKNNFVPIYLRWIGSVRPLINFDFAEGKKQNILDSDFYLADLFVDDKDTVTSEDDVALKNELFVVFRNGRYEIAKENLKTLFNATIELKDRSGYEQFWKRYKRPPIKEFQDYIVERRDLLVPQDIRERKGAFFTPRKWVELSQRYLADVLGEDWQEEYYVWDCAAGTGNLLAGLTNKYNIWASTLDQADVNVMHERIEHGANLLKNHVFQFDFLNDDFSKLPNGLRNIIADEKKRKKLLIYINPPYAEVSSKAEKGKVGVNLSTTHTKYKNILGTAGRELFTQFLIRIYAELNGVIIGEFSTLKLLQGPAFISLKNHFRASLKRMFVAPANTFDNVKGEFPIGFKIWNTSESEDFNIVKSDVYNKNAELVSFKTFYSLNKEQYINKWISLFKNNGVNNIGFMDGINANDFQHNNIVYILNSKLQLPNPRGIWINRDNLIPISIYFSVRKCLKATWLNDRDQFLAPNNAWESDLEFQNDCLIFALFNNNIQSKFGTNHWIPFTESEVEAQGKFKSHFMINFIKGNIDPNDQADDLLAAQFGKVSARVFSKEAKVVFDAGRELWKYYHSHNDAVVDASLYDIREFFQGRDKNGRMNPGSEDALYTNLIGDVRERLELLSDKIALKVYDYGFLMK